MALSSCIECGKQLSPGPNKTGLCFDCAIGHVIENAKQMKKKEGPYYEKWKAGMKAAVKRL